MARFPCSNQKCKHKWHRTNVCPNETKQHSPGQELRAPAQLLNPPGVESIEGDSLNGYRELDDIKAKLSGVGISLEDALSEKSEFRDGVQISLEGLEDLGYIQGAIQEEGLDELFENPEKYQEYRDRRVFDANIESAYMVLALNQPSGAKWIDRYNDQMQALNDMVESSKEKDWTLDPEDSRSLLDGAISYAKGIQENNEWVRLSEERQTRQKEWFSGLSREGRKEHVRDYIHALSPDGNLDKGMEQLGRILENSSEYPDTIVGTRKKFYVPFVDGEGNSIKKKESSKRDSNSISFTFNGDPFLAEKTSGEWSIV